MLVNNINDSNENVSYTFVYENLKTNLSSIGWTEEKIYKASLYLKEIYRFIIPAEGYRYDKMLISFLNFSQATGYINQRQASIAFEVFTQYLNDKDIKVEVINFYNIDRIIDTICDDYVFLNLLYEASIIKKK